MPPHDDSSWRGWARGGGQHTPREGLGGHIHARRPPSSGRTSGSPAGSREGLEAGCPAAPRERRIRRAGRRGRPALMKTSPGSGRAPRTHRAASLGPLGHGPRRAGCARTAGSPPGPHPSRGVCRRCRLSARTPFAGRQPGLLNFLWPHSSLEEIQRSKQAQTLQSPCPSGSAAFPKRAHPWGPKSRRLHCSSRRAITWIHSVLQPHREAGVRSLPRRLRERRPEHPAPHGGPPAPAVPAPPRPARRLRGLGGEGTEQTPSRGVTLS